MGYGNYSQEAHRAIVDARAKAPGQAIFRQTNCHPLMNPKGVRYRESRDSTEHPNSLGIAFALDVTGSMGEIPDLLARKTLPTFMRILESCRVKDPQVLFLAIGDANSDRAPLQVGQFETTAELMDQWLTWTYLEAGGGGGGSESYELALYFLSEHTDMDCFAKRKKRGYLFMTGDEKPYPSVSKHQVEALIGDKLDDDVPVREVVAALQESFDFFFMIPSLERRSRCEREWRDLIGDHVIAMSSPEDTCTVAAGAIALTDGLIRDLDELGVVLVKSGIADAQVKSTLQSLKPYASTVGRDGERDAKLSPV